MFKELKLVKGTDLDKDAILTYLNNEVKDANWKTAIKEVSDECVKELLENKNKIVEDLEKSPFNIKKDQCNALPMAMITCIHLEGFVVILF